MVLEDAAEAMYEGIRARDPHVSFPWQLASIVNGNVRSVLAEADADAGALGSLPAGSWLATSVALGASPGQVAMVEVGAGGVGGVRGVCGAGGTPLFRRRLGGKPKTYEGQLQRTPCQAGAYCCGGWDVLRPFGGRGRCGRQLP